MLSPLILKMFEIRKINQPPRMSIIRLNKVIKEFNVGLQTLADFLEKKGYKINVSPSEKITEEQYELLRHEFGADKNLRTAAEKMLQDRQKEKEKERKKTAAPEMIETRVPENLRPQVVVKGTIDLNPKPAPQPAPVEEKPTPQPAAEPEKAPEEPQKQPAAPEKPVEETPAVEVAPAPKEKPSVEERAKAIGSEEDGIFKLHTTVEVTGPKVLGTIDLSSLNQNTRPKKKSKEERRKEREEKNRQQHPAAANGEKKKRNRIGKEKVDVNAAANQQGGERRKPGQGPGAPTAAQGAGKRGKDRNRKAQPSVKTEVSDEVGA